MALDGWGRRCCSPRTRWSPRAGLGGGGRPYQALNLAGAALLALNSACHGALPSVAVNGVWIMIGMAALVTGLHHNKSNDHKDTA